MNEFKRVSKYSIGMGDRFAHQAQAQLQAVISAKSLGIEVTPVWNKSNREHMLIGTEPSSVLAEAQKAVVASRWDGDYYIDADHINLGTVDRFIEPSNFFTIDVADYTGKPASAESLDEFVKVHKNLVGNIVIPGIASPLTITDQLIRSTAEKFLWSMQEAGRIYRHIASKKKPTSFITEVSVDETDAPQSPAELLLILAMIASEDVPVQTIAPKFTGRFNKGVDYVGNVAQFEKEFDEDLCVVAFAIKQFGLPDGLKLSVHSGSDKFSLYPIMNRLIKKHDSGLHIKTAGTNWLEELIGLAEAGGEGLAIAKEVYAKAIPRSEELIKPYAPVVDIDSKKLPSVDEVQRWTSAQFTNALRHDQKNPEYNLHFRQFLHVSFKIAAEMGSRFTEALEANAEVIAKNVSTNLLERHLKPVFG